MENVQTNGSTVNNDVPGVEARVLARKAANRRRRKKREKEYQEFSDLVDTFAATDWLQKKMNSSGVSDPYDQSRVAMHLTQTFQRFLI